MYEATEARQFPVPPEALARAVPAAAFHAFGVSLTPTSPGLFLGRGAKNSWGITPTIQLRVVQGPQGSAVEALVGADVEPLYLALAVIVTLAVFPLGLVVPFLAMHDFDTKRKIVFFNFWGHMTQALGPGAAPPVPLGPPAATAPGPYGGGGPPQNPYVGR